MDIHGKSFSLFAAALFTALPFASVRADDVLADLVPAYHFAFDGDCAQASGDSETITWSGQATSDAAYFVATKTGGKALKVATGYSTPYASSISYGTGDFTVLCSARVDPLDGGTIWCIGHKSSGSYSLSSRGVSKVSFSRRTSESDIYAGEVTASLVGEMAHFHSYAVVYHAATRTADFYVDGAKVGTTDELDTVGENGTANFQIGSTYAQGGDTAVGTLIDDWRLYKTALTEGQIAEYFTSFPVQCVKADYRWIATEEAAWSDGANWQSVADGSTGTVPGSTHSVEIPAGAKFTLSGNVHVDNMEITGTGEITFHPNGKNKWFQVRANKVGGTGTLALEGWWYSGSDRAAAGLECAANSPMYVATPVIVRDITTTPSRDQDVWFKGYDNGAVYLLCDTTVESGYMRLYQHVKILGDLTVATRLISDVASNEIGGKFKIGRDAWCYFTGGKITGTLELEAGDSIVSGQIRLEPKNVTLGDVLTGTLALGEDASIRIPQGVTLEKAVFAEGAKVYVMVSDASASALTIGEVELPDGADIADHVVAIDSAGARTPYTVSLDPGTGVVTAAAGTTVESTEPVTTTWVGGSSDDWWNNTNWTLGRPYENDTAIIPVDLTISPGDITISNLVIATGKTLFIKRRGNGWPTLRVYETNGGTIRLSCNGFKPQTSVGSEGANIRSDVVVDPTSAGANQDCWIEGNSADSPLNFYGTLYATNSAFRVNQNMNLYGAIVCGYTSDNDNYFNNSVVKSGGEIRTVDGGYATLNAASTVEAGGKVNAEGGKLKLNSGITINGEITGTAAGVVDFGGPATINGNITGSPVVLANGSSGTFALNGDNGEFAGVFSNRTYNLAVTFNNVAAGSAKAKWTIYGDAKATSLTEGTLKFGELNYYKDSWCVFYFSDSDDCSLVVEVGELGTDCSFSAAGDCWFGKSSNNSQTPNVKLVKKGAGTMQFGMNRVKFLEIAGGTVSMTSGMFPTDKVTFSGGTLAFTNDDSVNADRSARFSSENTGPISIDTAGHDMTMATALTTSGAVVKNGEGALTLSAMPTCSGVTVNGGMLILPIDTTTELGTVSVAEGAKLLADGSGLSVTENTPVAIFTGTADADSLGRIGVVGADWNWTASFADGTISANPVAWGDVPNVWVGGESGAWHTALNWSRGVAPGSSMTAKFTNDVDYVTLTAGATVAELVVDNANVALHSSSIWSVHPSIDTAAISGTGKISLYHAGIRARNSSGNVEIPETITMEILYASDTSDSWLEGNGNTKHLVIRGPLTGPGYLITRSNVDLYGDNSGLTYKARCEGVTTLYSLDSGSENAIWEFNDDLYIAPKSGTVKFGQITFPNNNMKMARIYPDAELTIEVGGRGGDFATGTHYFFGEWNYGSRPLSGVTLKKVGTGKMTNALYGIPNVIVAEGEMALAESTYGNLVGGVKGFSAITVKDGAALSGTTSQSIALLTFESGSVLAPTVTYTAAVPAVEDDPETEENEAKDEVPASWTVSAIAATEATVQDMIVRLDADSIAALANIPGETPAVLSATTLNGKPNRVAQDSNGDSIAVDASSIWLVRRIASEVKLIAGEEAPGLMILIQ